MAKVITDPLIVLTEALVDFPFSAFKMDIFPADGEVQIKSNANAFRLNKNLLVIIANVSPVKISTLSPIASSTYGIAKAEANELTTPQSNGIVKLLAPVTVTVCAPLTFVAEERPDKNILEEGDTGILCGVKVLKVVIPTPGVTDVNVIFELSVLNQT